MSDVDRGFWVFLSGIWRDWRRAVVLVEPETGRAVAPLRFQTLLLRIIFSTKQGSSRFEPKERPLHAREALFDGVLSRVELERALEIAVRFLLVAEALVRITKCVQDARVGRTDCGGALQVADRFLVVPL